MAATTGRGRSPTSPPGATLEPSAAPDRVRTAADQLAGRPASWELAAHGLAVAESARAHTRVLEVSALEFLATEVAVAAGEDDPADLRLLARYGADLLAAHGHPPSRLYRSCAQQPHPTVAPELLTDWWLTWYHRTRDGMAAVDVLSGVVETADGHRDAIDAVSRWFHAAAAIVARANAAGRALLVVDGWPRHVQAGQGDSLLAAAFGRWPWKQQDGVAVVEVPGVVGRWAYRHAQLRYLPVPTLRVEGDHSLEYVLQLLSSPEGRDALDAQWAIQLAEIDGLATVPTLDTAGPFGDGPRPTP